MLNIILYLIIIISFSGIVFVVARKIPHLAHLSNEEVVVLSRQKGLIKKTTDKIKTIKLDSYGSVIKSFFIKLFSLLGRAFKKSKEKSGQTITWLGKKTGSGGNIIKQGSKKVGNSIKGSTSSIKSKIQDYRASIAEKKKQQTEKEKKDILEKAIEESQQEFSEEATIEKDLEEKEKFSPKKEDETENESRLMSFDDLDKPIEQEQKIIDLIVENPKNIIAYKALGLLYWKQCNYKDAKDSLEAACKLGSKDRKIKEVLEEIENKLGNNLKN